MARIVLFANTAWYLYNFRLSLAKALRARGDRVTLLSPHDEYAARLEEEGFPWVGIEFDRSGLNPILEIALIGRLVGRYRGLKPDLVHHFTVKPVLYGSVAALVGGRPAVVNSITGMGYIALARGLRGEALRLITRALYRGFLPRRSSKVIFQNQSDRDHFLEAGLVPESSVVVIPGSGVDIRRFHVTREPEGEPVVLMASRMLWDKGVGELIEASRLLRSRGLRPRIILAGRPDAGNPRTISEEQLRAWDAEGVAEWVGHREDMPDLYERAQVVVLPSYGEGLPKSLVEAAACGRAIIATDVPGCRQAVDDGVNGLLVKSQDAVSLADAIQSLLQDPGRRAAMGRRGRERAEREFSNEQILRQTLEVYDSLLSRRGGES